ARRLTRAPTSGRRTAAVEFVKVPRPVATLAPEGAGADLDRPQAPPRRCGHAPARGEAAAVGRGLEEHGAATLANLPPAVHGGVVNDLRDHRGGAGDIFGEAQCAVLLHDGDGVPVAEPAGLQVGLRVRGGAGHLRYLDVDARAGQVG